ncbi:hypothetical protein ANN_25653 [Periplaneta americana]|uniref:Ionotropic glutamate receptor C-terminal domain-containing protein n=1 Tax=Periplaneta americana TaxID=6978 RepID=A0ABQ8S4A5_PERAM|nr:hypothetical protein ANN_25653 [Periplaneta americana]
MNAAVIIVSFLLFQIEHLSAALQYTPQNSSYFWGELVHEITQTYFSEYRCIIFITQDIPDILDFVPPGLQIFNFQIGSHDGMLPEVEETDTLDSTVVSDGTKIFERMLIQSMDAGCQGYVIQVRNPRSVVYSFARTTRRAVTRSDKRYFFLSTSPDFDVQEIFSMREMLFMPELIIAKVSKTENCNLQTSLRSDHTRNTRNTADYKYQLKNSDIKSNNCQNQNAMSCNTSEGENQSYPEESFQKRILHVPSKSNCVEIVTHKFVGNGDSNDEVSLDFWEKSGGSSGLLHNTNLFPDKIRNLHGKKLQVLSFPWSPFVIMEQEGNTTIRDGIDVLILNQYCSLINATWELNFDDDWWGDIYPNGSGIGLVGNLAMDHTDLAIGALFMWPDIFQWLDASASYAKGAEICLAPKPKMIPKWLSPFLPFPLNVWLGVGFTLLCLAVTFSVLARASRWLLGALGLERYFRLGGSVILTMGMFVEQSPPDTADQKDRTHTPIRQLVSTTLLYALLLSTAYSSGLASVLTVPQYEKPIDTLKDLAMSDYVWVGNHPAWTWAIENSDDPVIVTLTKKFRIMEDEVAMPLLREGKIAFPLEKYPGGHFGMATQITEEDLVHQRIMKETFYWSHIIMMTRKSSAYVRHLNVLLGRLNAAGIPSTGRATCRDEGPRSVFISPSC